MTKDTSDRSVADISEPKAMVLAERLDSKAADDLLAALLAHMGGPISLDASRVQSLGALCAGILLSAAKTWKDAGLPFALANLSERCRADLALMGLTETRFEEF
ncbi:STAS domain-containing protein [Shimia sp. CNT1-13L.2]|uniref:STAS domain-containing protein n=1 Tax=Shimia sp. CNT1-13L.2 TaxID=2959663 RepID=UPI0020CE78C0|nr:STAS domain-containing protein [Shimia sp. CNT1-13L.2]MCP9483218.1 STAS domain-containing protein [Shimia sp. CNT1-13L.2]